MSGRYWSSNLVRLYFAQCTFACIIAVSEILCFFTTCFAKAGQKISPAASQSPTAYVGDFPGMSWHHCNTEKKHVGTSHHTHPGVHTLSCLSEHFMSFESYLTSPSDNRGTHGRRQFRNRSGSSIWDSNPVVNSCTIWEIKCQWHIILILIRMP